MSRLTNPSNPQRNNKYRQRPVVPADVQRISKFYRLKERSPAGPYGTDGAKNLRQVRANRVADKSMESSEFKTTQFGRFVMRAENKAKKLKEASHRIPIRHPKQLSKEQEIWLRF